MGLAPPKGKTISQDALIETEGTNSPKLPVMKGSWGYSQLQNAPLQAPASLAGVWKGTFRSWGYLKSLYKRELRSYLQVLISTSYIVIRVEISVCPENVGDDYSHWLERNLFMGELLR